MNFLPIAPNTTTWSVLWRLALWALLCAFVLLLYSVVSLWDAVCRGAYAFFKRTSEDFRGLAEAMRHSLAALGEIIARTEKENQE